MNREIFIKYLENNQANTITDKCIDLVSDYLKDKFNFENRTFIANLALMDTNRFLIGRNNIIEDYIKKYDVITWIYDKNDKLLKVL